MTDHRSQPARPPDPAHPPGTSGAPGAPGTPRTPGAPGAPGTPGASGAPRPTGEVTYSDDALLADLAAMWRATDPPPVDLAAELCAVVEAARAAEDIASEYELLTLVATDLASLGVRSATRDLVVIEFTGPGFHVLLRITPERVDGWVAPAGPGTVRLDGPTPLEAEVDDEGRFVLDGAAPGLATLRFALADGRRHETPPFNI